MKSNGRENKAIVLVVEDDETYRSQLNEALQQAGFAVRLAENGQVALEILRREKVDCILLDILMPQMDGTEFFYRLKNDLKVSVPTIILTNLAQAPHQADIKEYLVKANTSLDQVIEAVKRNLLPIEEQ